MIPFQLDTDKKITSGFKTPDGYFDDFQAKMLERLPEREIKTVPISQKKTWIYAVAAVLVVALTIPIYKSLKQPAINLDTVTIENYIAVHSGISDEDFAELLDEKDIEQIKVNSHIEDKAIEDLLSTNSNLEEYITN